MKLAPKLENERERLESLLSYDILDTEPELALDQFTSLASIICGTPVALISLIDSDRQWFKSKLGIDAKEGPRDISFCGHAVEEKNIFIVPDSLKDDRFRDNPFVSGDPHVRFYAGAPLVTPCGYSIGTLCVVDFKPKILDSQQVKALQFLAEQIITHFELRKSLLKSKEDFKELQRLTKVISSQNEKLHQMDKFVSLAGMASGMAHEINNPLAVIMGSVYLLKDKSEISLNKESLCNELEKIKEMTDRISKIIKALAIFSGADVDKVYAHFSVKELLDHTLLLYGEKLKNSGVRLIRPLQENIFIEGNFVQFSKVIYNLLDNAFCAVKDQNEKWISFEVKQEVSGLRISITDSGYGINPRISNRLMEPFFTTKDVGSGTGLGLSISKGIIENCGGELILESDSPNTKFSIYLPKKDLQKTS